MLIERVTGEVSRVCCVHKYSMDVCDAAGSTQTYEIGQIVACEMWQPDLTDPATVGCLAALVREVWGDESVHVIPLLDDTGLAWETDSDAYHREALGGPNHTTPYRWGRTQGETWAHALLAHREERDA